MSEYHPIVRCAACDQDVEERKLEAHWATCVARPGVPAISVYEEPKQVSQDLRQVGGDHYKRQSIQPWDAMAAWMTPAEFVGFMWGNLIKYVARWRHKGGLEDLKKARHYLDKLIEMEEARGV